MKQLSSSLKNYNFKGWTTEKIIEKYESVLASRENQIADLASEIGTVSDKFNSIQDQYSILHNEYLLLQNKFMKKEELLQQELKNKEILLMRLEKSENDYEELNRRYENLVKIVNSMSEQRESNMNSDIISSISDFFTLLSLNVLFNLLIISFHFSPHNFLYSSFVIVNLKSS